MNKELTVFHYEGKNYIGYFCTGFTDDTPAFNGIGKNVADFYVFQGPCELTYNISITSDSTADISANAMPIFPGAFYSGDKNNIYFAFPKAGVVFSPIKAANIHANIINQFKQLTGLA